jgi:hypothetical protein
MAVDPSEKIAKAAHHILGAARSQPRFTDSPRFQASFTALCCKSLVYADIFSSNLQLLVWLRNWKTEGEIIPRTLKPLN